MDEPMEPAIPEPRATTRRSSRAPRRSSKTSPVTLWVLLGLVVVAVGAAVAFVALGGLDLFTVATGPAEAIEAINQAAVAGDAETYAAHFDVASVAEAAYPLFLDEMKTKPEYAEFIADVGEEEADRILREEVLPLESFVANLSGELDMTGFSGGAVPFPSYTITQTTINDSVAELALTTIEDGAPVSWVLGMELETVGSAEVWRIKQIKNIAEVIDLAN